MTLLEQSQDKLSKRHEQLLEIGGVVDAIKLSEVSEQTYYRALRKEPNVAYKTIKRIIKAQKAVLVKEEKEAPTL